MALSWPEQLSRVWTLSRNSSSYQEQQPTNQQFLLFCSCVIVCVCVCRFLFFFIFSGVLGEDLEEISKKKKVSIYYTWVSSAAVNRLYFQGIIRSETIPRDFHYGLSAYKVVIYSCARCIWIIIIRHNRSVRKKSSSAHTQHRCCRLKSDTGENFNSSSDFLCVCVDVIAHHHPVFLSSNQQQQQQSEAGTNSYTFWNQIKIY